MEKSQSQSAGTMNGASRKRHHAGYDKPVHVAHSSSHKKARILTPQTAVYASTSSRVSSKDNGFRRQEVTDPGSEEIDQDEERDHQVEEMQSQEVEEDSVPLVVFQCNTCRSIFGDSYAFVCSTEQLWLLTLSHVTNVALAPEVQTANAGLDAGSSYYELLCQTCQAVLGRKYLTTPGMLDGIRDLFSFSTEAITSYSLGEPMQQPESGADQNMLQRAAVCHVAMRKLASDRNEVARLRDEMEKVKGLMVTVDDRLAHLEGTDKPESDEEATHQQRLKVQA